MKKIICLICVAALCSCSGNREFNEEISSVDSLQTVVSGLRMKMDSINFDEMKETSAESKAVYKYLNENYKDSTNRKFWINEMNALRQVMKIMMRHEDNCNKIIEDLQYTEKQLSDLENSLTDKKVSKEDAKQYLSDEKKAVEDLKMQVQKSQALVLSAINSWDTLNPQMTLIVDSLKTLE